MNVITAAKIPRFPIWVANVSSFYCKGVSSGSCWIFIFKLPYWDRSPTANTIYVPVPSTILDPETKKGLVSLFIKGHLYTSWAYPVIPD